MYEDEISEDEIEDALFFAGLHGIRDVEIKTIRQWIEREGYTVDRQPDDEKLPTALATLIDRLADIGVLVHSTDHLSDRELYEFLLEHLGGHMALLPDSFLHIDVIGSGSEEDNELYLRYYATEDERAEWKARYPDEALPPREKPPYDRDRSLP